MLGNFSDPRVAAAVGDIFGEASAQMRGRGARSILREEDGQLPVSETSMTDILVDEFSDAIAGQLERAQGELRDAGVDLSVTFEMTRPPREHEHGADLGIRITLISSDFISTKACLVQCKRMYGPRTSPTFKEIRDRGERQATSMLRITPASFFMLYSFLPQEELLQLAGVPLSVMCPKTHTPTAARHAGALHECAIWKDVGALWDLGIAMISANRIHAMSTAAAIKHVQMPIGAAEVLPGAWPFATFAIDLFGSCSVGDPRSDVVKLVTPARKWQAETATTGLPITNAFDGFAIRNYMDITLSAREEKPTRAKRRS